MAFIRQTLFLPQSRLQKPETQGLYSKQHHINFRADHIDTTTIKALVTKRNSKIMIYILHVHSNPTINISNTANTT